MLKVSGSGENLVPGCDWLMLGLVWLGLEQTGVLIPDLVTHQL